VDSDTPIRVGALVVGQALGDALEGFSLLGREPHGLAAGGDALGADLAEHVARQRRADRVVPLQHLGDAVGEGAHRLALVQVAAGATPDGGEHALLAGDAGDHQGRHVGARLAQGGDDIQARAVGQVHVDDGQVQVAVRVGHQGLGLREGLAGMHLPALAQGADGARERRGEDRVVLDQQRAHEASVTVEKAAWQRARRAWEVTCMIMRLWGRGKNGTVLRVTCHAVVHGRQTDRTVGPIVNLVSFEVSSPKRRR